LYTVEWVSSSLGLAVFDTTNAAWPARLLLSSSEIIYYQLRRTFDNIIILHRLRSDRYNWTVEYCMYVWACLKKIYILYTTASRDSHSLVVVVVVADRSIDLRANWSSLPQFQPRREMNRNVRKDSADSKAGLVKNETPDEEIKVRKYI